MMVDEFDSFCSVSGLYNDLFTTLDVSHIFNLSLFTQEDEIKSGKHCQADLLEFMEMICRIAADASHPPPPTQGDDGSMIESDMT